MIGSADTQGCAEAAPPWALLFVAVGDVGPGCVAVRESVGRCFRAGAALMQARAPAFPGGVVFLFAKAMIPGYSCVFGVTGEGSGASLVS